MKKYLLIIFTTISCSVLANSEYYYAVGYFDGAAAAVNNCLALLYHEKQVIVVDPMMAIYPQYIEGYAYGYHESEATEDCAKYLGF